MGNHNIITTSITSIIIIKKTQSHLFFHLHHPLMYSNQYIQPLDKKFIVYQE